MASRIIRSTETTKANLSPVTGSQDQIMAVEKQAFEQGYREGERIGKQMGERMIEAVVQRYDRCLGEFGVAQRQLAECMEREAANLAVEIAKKLIHRELTVDPDLAVALSMLAVKRVVGQGNIVLKVSPADFGRVREEIERINPEIRVAEDSSLERGDLVLDTAQTHLDGRLSSQLDSVRRALTDA